jgi:hypothetical protein
MTFSQIGADDSWIFISGGDSHSMGLKSNGTLWGTGDNTAGQLGNSLNNNQSSFIQIGTENSWITISAGVDYTIGVKLDRSMYCTTGTNANGQLGDNTVVNKNYFVCNTNCFPADTPTISDKTICSGETVSLSYNSQGILSWFDINGNYLGSEDSYTSLPLTSSTSYFVQDSTCLASDLVEVVVNVNQNPNVTTGLSGETITVAQTSASYMWLECGPTSGSYTSIPSENSQFFIATANGQYAVMVNLFGCIDTSECVTISTIGLKELNNEIIFTVSPNPNNGSFSIKSTIEGTYYLVNGLGQKIQMIELNYSNNFSIKMDSLHNGVYFIVDDINGFVSDLKIVVLK